MDRVVQPTHIEFVKIYQLRVVTLEYAFLVFWGTFAWHVYNQNISAYSHTIKALNEKVARPSTPSRSLWLGLPGSLGKVNSVWLHLFCLPYIYIILLMQQRLNIILEWYFIVHGPQNFALKLRSQGSLHLDNLIKGRSLPSSKLLPDKEVQGSRLKLLWSAKYFQTSSIYLSCIKSFLSFLSLFFSLGRNLAEMSM